MLALPSLSMDGWRTSCERCSVQAIQQVGDMLDAAVMCSSEQNPNYSYWRATLYEIGPKDRMPQQRRHNLKWRLYSNCKSLAANVRGPHLGTHTAQCSTPNLE